MFEKVFRGLPVFVGPIMYVQWHLWLDLDLFPSEFYSIEELSKSGTQGKRMQKVPAKSNSVLSVCSSFDRKNTSEVDATTSFQSRRNQEKNQF